MSTAEVACVLATVLADQIADVNCYGVEVPHSDGRAGMAAIALADGVAPADVDWAALVGRLEKDLAAYAQPLVLRVARSLTYTSTFKHKKDDYRREGMDPRTIEDELYLRDPRTKRYVRLTPDLYDAIASGSLRL